MSLTSCLRDCGRVRRYIPVSLALLAAGLIGANAAAAGANPVPFVHTASLPRHQAPLDRLTSQLAPSAESVLYSFKGGSDGSFPNWGVIEVKGSLYGSTIVGGNGPCRLSGFDPGCGVAFKLTAVGGHYTERVLYSFQGQRSSDGAAPSGLIADSAGALYGTTQGGGGGCNCGTVFKLTPSGSTYTETILYVFRGGSDGRDPIDQLLADASGALYGVTFQGGGSTACAMGCGTVFKLTPTRSGYSERVIHAFKGTDGAQPTDGVVADARGSLYGTTELGGADPSGGVLYKLTPTRTGYSERLLYSFQGGPNDGSSPECFPIADANGGLYGTTLKGGPKNVGTVFKLTPSGNGYTQSLLYSFQNGLDGRYPNASLLNVSGALFGLTTAGGGGSNIGTIYKLTPMGGGYTETVEHSFTGPPGDGYFAAPGALVAGKIGALFGTTQYGGSGNCPNAGIGCGTVFKFTP
jgi:uncharacterized repeat protein (TIGR03803 family)